MNSSSVSTSPASSILALAAAAATTPVEPGHVRSEKTNSTPQAVPSSDQASFINGKVDDDQLASKDMDSPSPQQASTSSSTHQEQSTPQSDASSATISLAEAVNVAPETVDQILYHQRQAGHHQYQRQYTNHHQLGEHSQHQHINRQALNHHN